MVPFDFLTYKVSAPQETFVTVPSLLRIAVGIKTLFGAELPCARHPWVFWPHEYTLPDLIAATPVLNNANLSHVDPVISCTGVVVPEF